MGDFKRITIIGLGLIGSSIAQRAHAQKLAPTIVGCDRNEVSLAYATKHGFVDEVTTDPLASVKNSDLVILAAPPAAMEDIAAAIAPNLRLGTIVMDVCSVKQPAIAAIAPHIPTGVFFIPAHPIAGSEQAGVAAGRADLFEHKRIIITPDEPLQDPLKQIVIDFWESMGARVEGMPAHLHDMIYAYVSHLPQLLAFAANAAISSPSPTGGGRGGGIMYGDVSNNAPLPTSPLRVEGFNRFIRLAGSSPELWTEIFALNSANLLKALDRYLDVIAHIRRELKQAPEGTPTEYDETQAHTALFPRIASSCLITTVMEAEKQAGFSFKRYAGTGFADFTYVATQPPDEDLERISAQYPLVGAILGEYAARLQAFHDALTLGAGDLKMLLG